MSKRGEGISSGVAAKVASISARQLDYWCSTGLITPSRVVGDGKGNHRRFSVRDVVELRTVKALLAEGLSLQKVRKALRAIGKRWPEVESPLASMVLVTDGDDLFAVLPETEARDTVLSLVLRPDELAWRCFVIDVGRIAREVHANLEEPPKRKVAGGRR